METISAKKENRIDYSLLLDRGGVYAEYKDQTSWGKEGN